MKVKLFFVHGGNTNAFEGLPATNLKICTNCGGTSSLKIKLKFEDNTDMVPECVNFLCYMKVLSNSILFARLLVANNSIL